MCNTRNHFYYHIVFAKDLDFKEIKLKCMTTFVCHEYLRRFNFDTKFSVVTGATDGIGKEYARQLARLGINIVLISRTESKLQAVAREIGRTLSVYIDN